MSNDNKKIKENVNKSNYQEGKNTMNNTYDTVTILKCRSADALAAKKFSKGIKGEIYKKSFSAGKLFNYESRGVSSLDEFYEMLLELAHEPKKSIIRGKPKPNIKDMVRRKVHPPHAAFDPEPHYWVVLDCDKVACPDHIDPIKNPEEAGKWLLDTLPEKFRNVRCIVKFSSSQSIPKKTGEKPNSTISAHLIFWCDRKISDAEWKRYFKANPSNVDIALFSAVQFHYTSDPILEDVDNPLPKRIFILENELRILSLPPIKEPEKKPKSVRSNTPVTVELDNRCKALEMLLHYYQDGTRNKLCGAIAATLYRGGWEAENIADFILELAESAEDEEAMARHDNAIHLCDAIDDNRPVQGIPTLKDEFGIEELDEILTLLGVGKIDASSKISKLSNSSSPAEIEDIIKLLVTLSVPEKEICLEEIKNKTGHPKSVINKIFNATKKEYDGKHSSDQAVSLINILLDDYYEGGRLLLRIIDGNFWSYNGKYWVIEVDDSIKKKMLPIATHLYMPTDGMGVSPMINAALNLLKGRIFRDGDPMRLNSTPPMVINCQNGEVWFDGNGKHTFKPHRPESYLRNCLNVIYDPKATSPKFDKAVYDIFSKSSDPASMFRHMMEIIGYICQPWRKIPVILLLLGGGSNGKSSLTSILEQLLGNGNYMADRINQIESNIFKIGALDGKLMLIDDDVETGTCLPDGFLKKISEEKTMSGQHKNKPSFEFKCRALPIMLSNHYPSMKDVSEGLRRRLMVIPFMRKFTKQEIVPGLFDDIWAEESSGILNHAIEGFQRLKERSRFDEPQDCLEAKALWLVRSNELATFIDDYCLHGSDRNQPLVIFYSNFQEYCADAGVKKVPTRKGVQQRLESLGYDITQLDGYPTIRGLHSFGWGDANKTGEHLSAAVVEALANKQCNNTN